MPPPPRPTLPTPPGHEAFAVTYLRNGRTLPVYPQDTLLMAGLRAGLRLDFSCRKGGCGSCKSHLVSGQVQAEPGCLTDEERRAGLVLLCLAHPRSAVVISEGSDPAGGTESSPVAPEDDGAGR